MSENPFIARLTIFYFRLPYLSLFDSKANSTVKIWHVTCSVFSSNISSEIGFRSLSVLSHFISVFILDRIFQMATQTRCLTDSSQNLAVGMIERSKKASESSSLNHCSLRCTKIESEQDCTRRKILVTVFAVHLTTPCRWRRIFFF